MECRVLRVLVSFARGENQRTRHQHPLYPQSLLSGNGLITECRADDRRTQLEVCLLSHVVAIILLWVKLCHENERCYTRIQTNQRG